MKKLLVIICVLAIALSLVGCGAPKRELFSVNLSKYVDLCDFKGIKVDLGSKEFREYYDAQINSDIENNGFYVKKTEGTVAKGDTANINYVGKKDGVAFQGGTADNYDLVIGSGSFIDGFEDGLIGVEIGSTVDLNLTFPENYGNEELNGAAVVFTVTVNSVKTEEPLTAAEYFKELKFKTLRAYIDDVTERAVKTYLLNKVIEESEVKEYPEADLKKVTEGQKTLVENYYKQYGMTFESLLEAQGLTEEDFIKENVYPLMDEQMIFYAIMDKAGDSVTTDEVNEEITEIVNNNSGLKREELVEYYGMYYFESFVVSEKVEEYLYNNAKITGKVSEDTKTDTSTETK